MTAVIEALPAGVRDYVCAFVARQRRLALFKALGVAAAFALAWVLGWCLVDRLAALPKEVRVGLLAGGALGVGAVLWRPVRAALRREVDWAAAAQQIEGRNRSFAQRLETVTSQMLTAPAYRGSAELIDQLAQQVNEQAISEKPRRLLPLRLIVRPWLVAAVLAAVAAGLAQVPWLGLPTLVRRLVRPLDGIAAVTTTQLAVSPGSVDVPQGKPLDIIVWAQRLGDSRVTVHLSGDGREWSRMEMQPQSDGPWELAIPAVDRDRRYYVTGGDARSDVYTVRVQRTPGVAEFRIRYVYPAYTGRGPLVVKNTTGLIEAPVGTEASVSAVSTEPLAGATLVVGKDRIAMGPTVDERVRQATVAVTKDQPYQVELLSDRGMKGAGPATTMIRAVPDRPPLARLLEPAEDLRLHPREVVQVKYEVLDDYGVSALAVYAQVNAMAARVEPLTLRGDRRRQMGAVALDLAALDVKIGDVVTFGVRATDTADHRGESEERHVLVSPRSIDRNTHLRIAELGQAEDVCRALVGELETATKALGSPEFVTTSKIEQNVAGAVEAAVVLRQRLLRATVRSSGPAFSLAMANLVDGSQVVSSVNDEMVRVLLGNRDGNVMRDRLGRALGEARQVQERLKVIATGERAAAALADRANLLAGGKLAVAGKVRAGDRRQAAVEHLRVEVRRGVGELGLNPDAGDLDAQLQARVSAADALMKTMSALDYAGAATAWAGIVGRAADWQTQLGDRLAAGAQAEAVRPESNAVRARDLQLAGRAADRIASEGAVPGATTQPALAAALAEYPAALAALQKEHELSRAGSASVPAAEAAALRAGAEAARRKMAAWAGQQDVLAAAGGVAAARAEDLALAANVEAQRDRFETAAQIDGALAKVVESAAEGEAPAGRDGLDRPAEAGGAAPGGTGPGRAERVKQKQQEVSRAMRQAQKLHQIAQEQETISRQTESAKPEQVPGLAVGQGEVADEIEQVRHEQEGPFEAAQGNTREGALRAIQAAQERLAEMPQQLTRAQEAAAARRDAAAKAEAARRAAEAAPADGKVAAERLQALAQVDVAGAVEVLSAAVQVIRPDEAQRLSAALAPYAPETGGAVAALGEGLAPALRQMEQAASAQDLAGVERAAAAARQAIDLTQQALREAQLRVNERDPILAAKWFARQAAAALSRGVAEARAARQHQSEVSTALAKAKGRSVQQAAAGRLAQTNDLGSLYGRYTWGGGAGGGVGGGTVGGGRGDRDWGVLRPRDPAELKAGPRETDPPGYQEALKAYFDALGKGQVDGKAP